MDRAVPREERPAALVEDGDFESLDQAHRYGDRSGSPNRPGRGSRENQQEGQQVLHCLRAGKMGRVKSAGRLALVQVVVEELVNAAIAVSRTPSGNCHGRLLT